LTGATGYLGNLLLAGLGEQYDFILSARRPPTSQPSFPFYPVDLADSQAVRRLCQGIDTVIHLGGERRSEAAWDNLLPANISGSYHIFQAAYAAGCRRMVFASSILAAWGQPDEATGPQTTSVFPTSLYGASKAWGEALGNYYAIQKGLSTVCLRLGWIMAGDDTRLLSDFPHLSQILMEATFIRLVADSIEAPDTLRFALIHGLSYPDREWPDFCLPAGALKCQPGEVVDHPVRSRRSNSLYDKFKRLWRREKA